MRHPLTRLDAPDSAMLLSVKEKPLARAPRTMMASRPTRATLLRCIWH